MFQDCWSKFLEYISAFEVVYFWQFSQKGEPSLFFYDCQD